MNTFIRNILFIVILLISISNMIGQTQSVHNHFFKNNFPLGVIEVEYQVHNVPPIMPGVTPGFLKRIDPNDNSIYQAKAINNQDAYSHTWIFSHWNLEGSYETSSIQKYFDYNSGTGWSVDHEAIFLRSFSLVKKE